MDSRGLPMKVTRSLNDLLTVALALLLVLALMGVVYVAVTPERTGQSYTEFGLLNASDAAAGYPTSLTVNETGTVRVTVTNHENRAVSYRVVTGLGGRPVETYTVTLADGETDERAVSVTPVRPGETTLHVRLYREGRDSTTEPYRTLRLEISVTAQSPQAGSATSLELPDSSVGIPPSRPAGEHKHFTYETKTISHMKGYVCA